MRLCTCAGAGVCVLSEVDVAIITLCVCVCVCARARVRVCVILFSVIIICNSVYIFTFSDNRKKFFMRYIYKFSFIHSTPPNDVQSLTHDLQSCTYDIKAWMCNNQLKLNEDKTEAFLFSTPLRSSCHCLPSSIMVGTHEILFSDKVSNK